jgi:hypothetical protein
MVCKHLRPIKLASSSQLARGCHDSAPCSYSRHRGRCTQALWTMAFAAQYLRPFNMRRQHDLRGSKDSFNRYDNYINMFVKRINTQLPLSGYWHVFFLYLIPHQRWLCIPINDRILLHLILGVNRYSSHVSILTFFLSAKVRGIFLMLNNRHVTSIETVRRAQSEAGCSIQAAC